MYSNILIVTYFPIFKYPIGSMESKINVNKILTQKTYFMVSHDTGICENSEHALFWPMTF